MSEARSAVMRGILRSSMVVAALLYPGAAAMATGGACATLGTSSPSITTCFYGLTGSPGGTSTIAGGPGQAYVPIQKRQFSEFLLDLNEQGSNNTEAPSSYASLYGQSFGGSGHGVDLQTVVPVENVGGVAGDSFVYLYSSFGSSADHCRQAGAQDSSCRTGDGATNSPGSPPAPAGNLTFGDTGLPLSTVPPPSRAPLPATLWLFALGAAGFVAVRRSGTGRKAGPVAA